jgi:hypothetical protein
MSYENIVTFYEITLITYGELKHWCCYDNRICLVDVYEGPKVKTEGRYFVVPLRQLFMPFFSAHDMG